MKTTAASILFALTATGALFAGSAQAADVATGAHDAAYYGSSAAVKAADRTIVIKPTTRWVNVKNGETVTFAVGAVTGWYPYPFLDVGAEGAGSVALTCVGVTLLFLALVAGLSALDGRMRPDPVRDPAPDTAPTVATAE